MCLYYGMITFVNCFAFIVLRDDLLDRSGRSFLQAKTVNIKFTREFYGVFIKNSLIKKVVA